MNDVKITVSIGDEVFDTILVSGEPVEQPKYDMKRVLRYAIHSIDEEIRDSVEYDVSAEADRISELLQLRKAVSEDIKQLENTTEKAE